LVRSTLDGNVARGVANKQVQARLTVAPRCVPEVSVIALCHAAVLVLDGDIFGAAEQV